MSVIPTQDNLQMTGEGLIGKSTPGVGLSGRMDAAAIRAFIGSLTQAQIETLIAGAIAALVDSSPGTLDTLNELAAALGDDPNFAATTAAAIGAKYTKPSSGIPISDLTTTVQASLGRADTALQSLPTHNHTTADITGFGEAVDDEVASLLVQGSGISLTYNDAANTLTIASTATGTIGGSTGASDNAILLASGTGGSTVKASGAIIDASGNFRTSGGFIQAGNVNGVRLVPQGGLELGIGETILWSGTISAAGGKELGLRRNGTAVEVYNGTAGTFRDLLVRDITASGLMCSGVYTVGTLPSASANASKFAVVTDSSVTTNGSNVASGGSNRVMVFSNGTNWKVIVA